MKPDPLPPDARIVRVEMALPTRLAWPATEVTVRVGSTVQVTACDAVRLKASVTVKVLVTVVVELEVVLTVPVMRPPEDMDSPAGSAPEVTVQVRGATPPALAVVVIW